MSLDIDINAQLSLRLFRLEDSERYFQAIRRLDNKGDWYCDRLQRKYHSLELVRARVQDAIESKFAADGSPDFFIVYEEQIAGVFEVHPLTSDEHIEIGFWLFPGFRRQGLLSAVFPAVFDYAREHFEQRLVLAETALTNAAAQSLLESVGFVRRGQVYDDGEELWRYVYEL